MFNLPKLKWANSRGLLAEALGVHPERAALFETCAETVADQGGGLKTTLDAWQTMIPGISIEEWTAAVYAYGYTQGYGRADNGLDFEL